MLLKVPRQIMLIFENSVIMMMTVCAYMHFWNLEKAY